MSGRHKQNTSPTKRSKVCDGFRSLALSSLTESSSKRRKRARLDKEIFPKRVNRGFRTLEAPPSFSILLDGLLSSWEGGIVRSLMKSPFKQHSSTGNPGLDRPGDKKPPSYCWQAPPTSTRVVSCRFRCAAIPAPRSKPKELNLKVKPEEKRKKATKHELHIYSHEHTHTFPLSTLGLVCRCLLFVPICSVKVAFFCYTLFSCFSHPPPPHFAAAPSSPKRGMVGTSAT